MLSVFSPSCTAVYLVFILYWCTEDGPSPREQQQQCTERAYSCFLQHHNPAAHKQQQWAHVALVDDRTAAKKVDLSVISIDHLTNTTTTLSSPLSLLLLHNIAVCDLTLSLLQPCSAQCANRSSRQSTMRMRKIRAAHSVLVFVVVVIGIGLSTYLPQCVTGIFCSVPITPGLICSSTAAQ